MKHFLIFGGAFLLILILAVGTVRFLSGPEDTWLCQNGAWVKHGVPANLPTGICLSKETGGVVQTSTTTAPNLPTADNVAAEITISSPASNGIVSSPLSIAGEARGNWYFEAVFPIKLIGENGQVIAQGQATAQADWMSPDFVPFKAELKFDPGTSTIGMLVFANDNPSGLPQNEKQFGVPIRFSNVQKIPVKIYFGNTQLDSGSTDCSLVYPVERLITKTPAVARTALEQLLSGTNSAEKIQGYFSSINPGVSINSITIENGTAKVDFDAEMQKQLGGSCRVTGIRSQITQTLEQFPTVKEVIISVDGNVEEALQP
ncbi:MAG: GerMN domain-containing protein [Patescibacteria group bacterium]|nr:GerMN domain-containing protein [Patescibacteria group bacterium]